MLDLYNNNNNDNNNNTNINNSNNNLYSLHESIHINRYKKKIIIKNNYI